MVRTSEERYQYLRDSDRWGEDTEYPTWDDIKQAHGDDFDKLVDLRMDMEEQCQKQYTRS